MFGIFGIIHAFCAECQADQPAAHGEVGPLPSVGGLKTCYSWYKEFGMKSFMLRLWTENDGVLTFEWVLLVTLLTIGVVSGIAGVRDAIIDELGDVAQAMLALDQTYTIDFPLNVQVHALSTSSASDSGFLDAASYTDCGRTSAPVGQVSLLDIDS